ncbi:MAG: hypothetical protein SOR67_06080, partial [Alloprevotella sp.]|nr:hypothetical protein [Alloprevotella sp.]
CASIHGVKPSSEFSNPQKITCIIFENLFGPYFLPHQSHSNGYAPSSGENLASKMSFKSDATYYFHITYRTAGQKNSRPPGVRRS